MQIQISKPTQHWPRAAQFAFEMQNKSDVELVNNATKMSITLSLLYTLDAIHNMPNLTWNLITLSLQVYFCRWCITDYSWVTRTCIGYCRVAFFQALLTLIEDLLSWIITQDWHWAGQLTRWLKSGKIPEKYWRQILRLFRISTTVFGISTEQFF